jgi:hypothetical protein
MTLAAIYNTFDGEELLAGSIDCIHNMCDVIVLVWQQKSNYGEEKWDIVYNLLKLKERFPKILLLPYKPDLSMSASQNELAKRQFGLRIAQSERCSHYLFIDNDEYYDPKQFEAAQQKIDKEGYDATACRLYTYYKEPTFRLKPMEDYWVPFICEVKKDQVIGQGFNVYADPTRGTKPVSNFHGFAVDELVMHHYSYVRKDIRCKLENSSARGNFKNIHELVRLFEKWQPGEKMINFEGYDVEVVDKFPGFEFNLN